MRTLLFATLMFASLSSLACQFNTDCSPGSRCVKASGSLYGICAGGLFPGNSNDRAPAKFIPDPAGTIGNTCSFNVDCGPGNACMKSGGSIHGVCVRGR